MNATDRTTAMLPERDESLPDQAQGMYRKYEVYRTDRKDAGPGCKHWRCDYFVLDLTHDRHARAALAAYALACEATHPQLAADLRSRYSLPPAAGVGHLVPVHPIEGADWDSLYRGETPPWAVEADWQWKIVTIPDAAGIQAFDAASVAAANAEEQARETAASVTRSAA